jgi:hypothetical protein
MATSFADASGEVLRLQRGWNGASAGRIWEGQTSSGSAGSNWKLSPVPARAGLEPVYLPSQAFARPLLRLE